MKETLFLVMPAYNEEENISKIIDQWYPVIERVGAESRLLIVDDGSKDRTWDILYQASKTHKQLIPVTKSNSGHGSTCLYAYRYAIKENADYIFQTDSDGQTNPDEFWWFWENRKTYDFIIGSRAGRKDGVGRIFVTRVLQFLVWLVFHRWVEDANTPFRLMRTERLMHVLKIIPDDFFLCNVAISVIALRNNEKCIWVPITFKPRQGGVNSINMKRIIKIGYKAINDFRIINRNLKNLTNG